MLIKHNKSFTSLWMSFYCSFQIFFKKFSQEGLTLTRPLQNLYLVFLLSHSDVALGFFGSLSYCITQVWFSFGA